MYCLVSVVLRRWTAVHEEAQRLKRHVLGAASATGVERPPELRATSGYVVLVEWDEGRVLGGLPLPKPTGFLVERGQLHVALWEEDAVVTLHGAQIVRRRGHPWFNHLHTLDRTPHGLLVTSSGTDLIAELDEHGQLRWSFFMFEHGYGGRRTQLGASFDRTLDYNGRYLPAALTSHPNSALWVDEHTVLATLFSAGQLVRIDRRSDCVDVILSDLRRPHAIRRRPDGGYLLSNTEGGCVVLLDRELRPEGQLEVPAPWIQDAVLVGERLLAVGNRRIMTHPLAGSGDDGGRDNFVIELRHGRVHKKLGFGPEHRIYMVEPLSHADAEALAAGFAGQPLELDTLRWEGG